MVTLTTTDGKTAVTTTLNDREAAVICQRIPANNKDRGFAISLVSSLNQFGNRISHNRRVWLHVMAYAQLRRERPAVTAQPIQAVPVVAPVAVAPQVARTAVEAPNHPEFPTLAETELNKVVTSLRLTMLMYDIPERSNVANPSGRLRRIGLRINKSVWIVPTGNIPQYLVNELIGAGAAVITAPYDVEASKNLLVAAIAFANRELTEAKARAEASKADAEAELNDPDGDPTKKRKVYEKKIAAIAKRLEVLAEEMAVGAKVFGVVGGIDFTNIRQAAEAISNTTAVRAAVYANSATALREVGTVDTTAMAVAVENDQAPAYAVADMLRENGNEEAADDVSDTFSLVDGSDGE
jgi:hypothetical protein